ncbi:PIN domain-containing protein [Spirosoma aerolatum]|uniref:hypothetical protein n=1 Tax=Spirosoma aerolatum TaxID=1211326 RepID=UPI001FE36B76|nr:hypothetical protein [Spirosoma aerolatum]
MSELLSRSYQLVYNVIATTEFIYHALGHYGQKAPRTVKEANRIPTVLDNHSPLALFNLFDQVTDKYPKTEEVIRLMTTYNMLPNDVLILAHCLTANISFVGSYSSGFQVLFRKGVVLIDSLDALDTHCPVS